MPQREYSLGIRRTPRWSRKSGQPGLHVTKVESESSMGCRFPQGLFGGSGPLRRFEGSPVTRWLRRIEDDRVRTAPLAGSGSRSSSGPSRGACAKRSAHTSKAPRTLTPGGLCCVRQADGPACSLPRYDRGAPFARGDTPVVSENTSEAPTRLDDEGANRAWGTLCPRNTAHATPPHGYGIGRSTLEGPHASWSRSSLRLTCLGNRLPLTLSPGE